MRAWPGLLGLALVGGCEHTQPFRPGDYAPHDPPFSGGSGRVTYNPGHDWMPSWLPDGSGFLYTFQRTDRPDADRCLGELPAGGGSRRRMLCNTRAAAADSVDVFEAAAAARDGRLVYVRASSRLTPPSALPQHQAIVLATLDAPNTFRVLQTLGFTAPSGGAHEAASHVRWVGDSAVVYLAERMQRRSPCGGAGCELDTLRWGVELATLAWSGSNVTLTVVPGTAGASSVTAAAGGDTIYYTVGGDSLVYRRLLSTGAVTVVHNFGAGRIARGVQVVTGRLVAVVGGDVSYAFDPAFNTFVQRDSGGPVVVVDPATGAERTVAADLRYRHPALSPAGDRLVTDVGRPADLWLLEMP